MRPIVDRVIFRLHWIFGLTAGLVLAVVGATGGLLGLEQPILDLANPALRISAPANATPLPPDAWIAAARAARPQLEARSLSWQGDDRAVTLRMAQGRQRGGSQVLVDPYSARVLGELRGTGFFRVVEDLHRHLAAGQAGRQLVGASTALLILLAITGLIQRWPRRHSLRAWLRPDTRLRGRGWWRSLHLVLGTWVLAFYLVAALTGLWWSYDFYRNALNSMAGVNGSLRPRVAAVAPGAAVQDSWDRLWQSFRAEVPDATAASLSLDGAAGKPVELRYQTPHSPHERAWDTLRIDPSSGKVLARQPYAELPRGRRFIGALFPLHSGGFFGEPGRILMAIASLLMPFFTVTGIWLWIARRRAEGSRRRAATVEADAETAS